MRDEEVGYFEPGAGFVIDRHPEYRQVLLISPCSGHGLKHSAAIGEAVAVVVTEGTSRLDLSPFGLGRFRRGQDRMGARVEPSSADV